MVLITTIHLSSIKVPVCCSILLRASEVPSLNILCSFLLPARCKSDPRPRMQKKEAGQLFVSE